MRFQPFTVYLCAFIAGCYTLPNGDMPKAFKGTIVGRAVGGNCNYTGTCVDPATPFYDPGECIGESDARCCADTVANQFCLH
ncbi:hypothetical protein EK21DRAFT_115333 [Setomelanomma holmii]|uniref:Uncharacterized protein n=1 Tax=Setomelanomma holmii TaxID=210430 RepID=A0A9P4H5B7_9PLEO|nr:hypothetical protein EK21DRAFT_115333 [Setomelanomma holmii]